MTIPTSSDTVTLAVTLCNIRRDRMASDHLYDWMRSERWRACFSCTEDAKALTAVAAHRAELGALVEARDA